MRRNILRRLAICSLVLATAVRPVWAHDQKHPELNDWLKSLTNDSGTPCCDGSDALRLENVDWQTTCEAGTGECHYQVLLEEAWWNVPDSAVLKTKNFSGPALVWPTFYWRNGDPKNGVDSVAIRCFLPGAGL
jgi:hypothetical protein